MTKLYASRVPSPESRLFDQQILFLLAALQRGQEPARTLAAAGPGFAAGRVAVFRRHLAGFAAAALAVNLPEGDPFGLEYCVNLGLDLGDFLLVRSEEHTSELQSPVH